MNRKISAGDFNEQARFRKCLDAEGSKAPVQNSDVIFTKTKLVSNWVLRLLNFSVTSSQASHFTTEIILKHNKKLKKQAIPSKCHREASDYMCLENML